MDAIGEIEISKASSIVFYVDEYKGKRYGNIRIFVRSKRYTGATKKGIKLDLKAVAQLLSALRDCPAELADIKEKEIFTITLNPGYLIKANISYFNGNYGIDIRTFYDTKKYKGYSKKGIRIPYEYLAESADYLQKIHNVLMDLPKDSLFVRKDEGEKEENDKMKKAKGVPDEYQKYF